MTQNSDPKSTQSNRKSRKKNLREPKIDLGKGIRGELPSSRDFLAHYAQSVPENRTKAAQSPNFTQVNTRPSPPQLEEERGEKKGGKGKRGKNIGSEPGDRGKSVGLRVIGGKFRALKLEYSGNYRVRPMKDRIRESVFNLLGTVAVGRHAVDLFAGTGALAIEALSRGASGATLIEVHFPTARILRRNLDAVISFAPNLADSVELVTSDVFFWGRNLATPNEPDDVSPFSPRKNRLPTDVPWLIFCSPPYSFYLTRQDEMLSLLNRLYRVAPRDSAFVIEADERFDFDLLGVEIPEKKRRTYLPAQVGIYLKESDPDE